MSAALNGNEGYLTDSLFKSICAAFPGTFNLDYLLTGEGSLLVDEGGAKVQDTDSGELEAHAWSKIRSPPDISAMTAGRLTRRLRWCWIR